MKAKHIPNLLEASKDAATALAWFAEALQGRGILTNGSIVLGHNIKAWRMARDCAKTIRDAIAIEEADRKEGE